MAHADKEPISGDEASGRILVKLRLPKIPEEVGLKVAGKAPPSPNRAAEIKSHYWKECDRSFSSGKALGGHMSSAHVQANKGYSNKNVSSTKMKRLLSGSGSTAAAASCICTICGKVFPSPKSLYGHMRCHPERKYRGMDPPMDSSSDPESDQNQDGDVQDQIDSGSPTADVGCNLTGWPGANKKGCGPFNIIQALGNQEVGEVSDPLAPQGPELGKSIDDVRRKTANNGKRKARALEHESSETGSTTSLPDDIDVEIKDESVRTTVDVLVNCKLQQIENLKRSMEEEMMPMKKVSPRKQKRVSEKSSSLEIHRCNICYKNFLCHQALGGHMASHNKFKMTIVNTADPKPKIFKVKKESKEGTGGSSRVAASKVADEVDKVVLGFDLNMIPDEQDECAEGDVDTSNHASES